MMVVEAVRKEWLVKISAELRTGSKAGRAIYRNRAMRHGGPVKCDSGARWGTNVAATHLCPSWRTQQNRDQRRHGDPVPHTRIIARFGRTKVHLNCQFLR